MPGWLGGMGGRARSIKMKDIHPHPDWNPAAVRSRPGLHSGQGDSAGQDTDGLEPLQFVTRLVHQLGDNLRDEVVVAWIEPCGVDGAGAGGGVHGALRGGWSVTRVRKKHARRALASGRAPTKAVTGGRPARVARILQ